MELQEGVASLHFVVATHSREVKTALFLALNTVPKVTIVATATSTAELVSYCRAFLPDVAIVEWGMPGRPLSEVLRQFDAETPPRRVFVIGEGGGTDLASEVGTVEMLADIDQLIAALSEIELEEDA